MMLGDGSVDRVRPAPRTVKQIRDAGYHPLGTPLTSPRLRQGVHAAAQRRQPALHAGDDAQDRAQGNPARHVVAGHRHRRHVPEVETVAGKLGRFETATDPAPTEMLETTIMLKPEWIPTNRPCSVSSSSRASSAIPAWRDGMTVEKLKAELTEKMKQVPGYVPAFLQPIENRILMLYTGIRAQVGVKIYGDNLDAIQRKAFEVERSSTASTARPAFRPRACRASPIST
jgi:hypothetical protein